MRLASSSTARVAVFSIRGAVRNCASFGYTVASRSRVFSRIALQASGVGRSTVTTRSARDKKAWSIAPAKLLVAMNKSWGYSRRELAKLGENRVGRAVHVHRIGFHAHLCCDQSSLRAQPVEAAHVRG